MLKQVENHIQKHSLLAGVKNLLVAVSGGPDSMVMLHLLHRFIGPAKRIRIIAAHLDHRLRGPESDQDAVFVKEMCTQWGVRLHSSRKNVKATCPKGESLENHARKLRYRFLTGVMQKSNAQAIATGHTRDDQVETVLMRLLEGAQAKGLRGILARRNDSVVRPLLATTRQRIVAYARRHGIPYRTDRSNTDMRFLRNRIRCAILPKLLSANPGLPKEMLTISQSAHHIWQLLEKKVATEINRAVSSRGKDHFFLDLQKPFSYPNYVIRGFLGVFLARPGKSHVTNLVALAGNHAGKRVLLPQGFEAWRTDKGILVKKPEKDKNLPGLIIPAGRKGLLSGNGFEVRSRVLKTAPKTYPGNDEFMAWMDADKAGPSLVFRNWKKGDVFRPFGMKGKKKVSDLLCEQKVPAPNRKRTLIMEGKAGIAWVVGHRIGDDYRITDNTKRFLGIELKKTEK